jgi:hypothetical protein
MRVERRPRVPRSTPDLQKQSINVFLKSTPDVIPAEPDPLPDDAILENLESQDPNFVLCALQQLSQILSTRNLVIPPPSLLNLLHLAASDDDEIAAPACIVLGLSMSFDSPVPTFLLQNGLLEIVNSRFPSAPVFPILANFSASNIESRAAVFECGVVQTLPSLIQSIECDFKIEISQLLSALTCDLDAPFSFEPFRTELFPVFQALFSQFDPSNESLCGFIITAFADFVSADIEFASFFVTQNFLPLFLSNPFTDPIARHVLHILTAIADANALEYLMELKAIEWAENCLFRACDDVHCAVYNFFGVFLIQADDPRVNDDWDARGMAEDAMMRFSGVETKYRTRCSIVSFVAEVIRGCSPGAVIGAMKNGEFRFVCENWDSLDIVHFLEVLVRIGCIPYEDEELRQSVWEGLLGDEELMERISEVAHGAEAWSGLARIVGEILCAEDDSTA